MSVDWAVEVGGLHVIRGGRQVLRDVTVQVRAGAVTGLLGPSGCGKTTLMRAIVGVQVVGGGRVTVLGDAGRGRPACARGSATCTQAPSVYGDLSVGENLRYFARSLGVGRARRRGARRRSVSAPLRRQLVGSLSGGERVARLAGDGAARPPRLLVLDEPTVGLDPVLRAELWSDVPRARRRGHDAAVSSHVMDEAAECDALLLMREGAILRQTTPDGAARARPASPTSAARSWR